MPLWDCTAFPLRRDKSRLHLQVEQSPEMLMVRFCACYALSLYEPLTMNILAISDVHDRFDEFRVEDLPDADVCVVAGDLTNYGMRRPSGIAAARWWLTDLGQRYVTFWIPGNHDIGVTASTFGSPDNVTCLLNHTIAHEGFTWRGVSLSTCYTLPELAEQWDYMTADEAVETAAFQFEAVDILISHSPPYGTLDTGGWVIGRGKENYGSPALAEYIARHAPRLVICGHVHESWGQARIGSTEVYNVAESARLIEAGGW